jgi:hypothetical protein
MGNQAFWLNLIEDSLMIKSQRGVHDTEFWNKKFLKLWKKNLSDFYADEVYNDFFQTVQLKSVIIYTLQDDNQLATTDKVTDKDIVIPLFSFTYKLPDMIQMVISEQLMEKWVKITI